MVNNDQNAGIPSANHNAGIPSAKIKLDQLYVHWRCCPIMQGSGPTEVLGATPKAA